MVLFIAIAVALTLLLLGGALWPLWRNSRGLMVGLVLLLCLTASALYRIVGTPAGVQAQPAAEATPHDLGEAIAALREALQRNPNEPEGWALLGRSLAAQGDFAGSREAFAKALALQPDDAELMVEAAQSRSLTDPQRRFDDEAVALLQRALQAQPRHQRATWFLGIAQRQRGQAAEAAKTWEPLLAQVDTATAASLRQQIDAARAEAGLPPLPETTPPAATGNALTVKVALDPDFAARIRLRGDASVFVIARIPGGPPMPVAAEKHALSELPLTVTLDDADSPMPTQKLSTLKEVEVFARISASGNAMREEGDIESAPVRVELPSDKPLELILGKSP